MTSLWRKLEEMVIQPVSEPSNPPPCGQPQQTRAPTSPIPPVRRGPAPPTQLDLVTPPQLELATQKPPNVTAEAGGSRLAGALAYSVVAQVKRSRTDFFFTRADISKVVLAFLEDGGRMGRKELVAKVVSGLGLPEHHNKRVENAFEEMERAGKINLSGDTVYLRKG